MAREQFSNSDHKTAGDAGKPGGAGGPGGRKNRLIRWCVWLVIAGAGFYLILPYLIPSSYIARAVQSSLEAQLGAPVQLGHIAVSWGSGVVIKDVTFLPAGGQLSEVRIEQISLPLEPIRLIFGGDIRYLQIQGVKLSCPVRGSLLELLGTLGDNSSGLTLRRPPIEELHLSRVQLQLNWDDGRQTCLKIPYLFIGIDRQAWRANWHTSIQVDSSWLDRSGHLAARGELASDGPAGGLAMSGPIRFTWRNVDLAALRLERVAGLDLRQLSGFSMGALELNVSADLQLHWSLVTKTTDFRIWRGSSDQASKIESIDFSSTGSIDPVSGKLVLEEVKWSGGGLSVISSLGASVRDGTLVVEDLSVSGQIQANILNQQLPELRALLGPEAQIGGRFAFDLEWHSGQFTDIKLKFDGNDLAITDSNLFNKRAGGPLSLQLDINGKSGQGRGLKLDNATIAVGPMTFTAGGYVPEFLPGADVGYYLKALASNSQLWANLKVTDLAGLGEMFGPLGDALAAGQLTGPAEVGFTYQGRVNRAVFKLVLDDQTVVDLEPYFKKQSGQKVELQLQIDLPPEAGGGLANMEFTGTIGQARFGTDGQSAKLYWAINPAGAGWLVDLSADLPIRLQAVDVLLGCLPKLGRLNLDRRLTGDLYLRARSNLQVQLGQGQWRISAMRSGVQVDASLAAINWQPQFVKQLDKVLLVDLDHRLIQADLVDQADLTDQAGLADQARQAGRQELTIGAQLGDLRCRVDLNRSGQVLDGQVEMHIQRAEQLARYCPKLYQYLEDRCELSGAAQVRINWRQDQQQAVTDLSWVIDGTGLGLRGLAGTQRAKRPGCPLIFEGRISASQLEDKHRLYRLGPISLTCATSSLQLRDGLVEVEQIDQQYWLDKLGVQPWLALRQAPIRRVEMEIVGSVGFDRQLGEMFSEVGRLIGRYNLAGRADGWVSVSLEDNLLTLQGGAEASKMSGRWANYFNKRPGAQAGVEFSATAYPGFGRDIWYHCQLDKLLINIGGARGQGQATFALAQPGNWDNGSIIDGLWSLQTGPLDLEALASYLPALDRVDVSGKGQLILAGQWSAGRVQPGSGQFKMDQLALAVDGRAVKLDGVVSFGPYGLDCPDLTMGLGEDVLTGSVQLVPKQGPGFLIRADFDSRGLDVDRIKVLAGDLRVAMGRGVFPDLQTSRPAIQPKKRMELFQPIRRLLADSDLVVSFRSDGLGLTDLRSNVRHDIQKFYCVLDSFASRGGPDRGQVGMRFSGQLNDGMIRGNVKLNLQDQNPTISLADELYNVNMTAQMQPLIENFFPGMNVSSKITIIEDLQFSMFDYPEDTPNYPEGQGEMIFGRGQLVGKAAPDWVTRIFPGLNFTRYRFSRMHNWFRKYPDGTVHNNMIFRGRPWNIYIEGDSFPDTWVNYEIGVDLLARYDSEYWSSVGQGRVPIFRSIGRVVNGKFEEQKIRYVPFHEVLYRVLVKNNVITGAYRMMLKRQRQNM